MSVEIQAETRLLAASILTGAALMAAYDLLRIFRLVVRHGWLWIGIEDFLYWVFSGFATFYLLYRENDGGLRLFVIAGVLASMTAYDKIFSINCLKLLKKAGISIKMRLNK